MENTTGTYKPSNTKLRIYTFRYLIRHYTGFDIHAIEHYTEFNLSDRLKIEIWNDGMVKKEDIRVGINERFIYRDHVYDNPYDVVKSIEKNLKVE